MRPSEYSERQTYLPTSAVDAPLAEPELGSSPTQKSQPIEARCSPPIVLSSCGPKMDLSTCISSPSSAHFNIFGHAILKLCAGGEEQREWNIDQQMPNHSSYSSAASPWGPIRAGRCWAARARCSDDAHRRRPVNQLAALGRGADPLVSKPARYLRVHGGVKCRDSAVLLGDDARCDPPVEDVVASPSVVCESYRR